MDFDYSPKTKDLQARLLNFMDDYIYPSEVKYKEELEANTAAGKRWSALQTIENLKPKAQAAGLWNLFLPKDTAERIERANFASIRFPAKLQGDWREGERIAQ